MVWDLVKSKVFDAVYYDHRYRMISVKRTPFHDPEFISMREVKRILTRGKD